MNRIVIIAKKFLVVAVALTVMGVLFIVSFCITLFQVHVMGVR